MNITNDFPVNNVINGIYFRRKWVNYTKRKEILRCIQDQRRGYVEYVLPTSDYKTKCCLTPRTKFYRLFSKSKPIFCNIWVFIFR